MPWCDQARGNAPTAEFCGELLYCNHRISGSGPKCAHQTNQRLRRKMETDQGAPVRTVSAKPLSSGPMRPNDKAAGAIVAKLDAILGFAGGVIDPCEPLRVIQ